MISQIKSLLKERKHCVLATIDDGRPYCSLMAYITDAPATCIFMVSHRHTRKFRNLESNPRVSLLVDSRDAPQAQALTIEGVCSEVTDKDQQHQIRQRFLEHHPGMAAFVDHPEAAFIRVPIRSVLFLDGLTDAHYFDFSSVAS
ncbi:MAG: pyridoxamine 5'-phosphate oxidase family protein [Thermodesulfobacteriota bacterium]|nr:pyridoxamine 5'-phosphate oxidase family protein [Thermodesulfobacteriota bacterium]